MHFGDESHLVLVALNRAKDPHPVREASQIFEGDPTTAAAQLVEKLKFEVRVI